MPGGVKLKDLRIIDPRSIGLPEALIRKDTLKRVTILVDVESLDKYKRKQPLIKMATTNGS